MSRTAISLAIASFIYEHSHYVHVLNVQVGVIDHLSALPVLLKHVSLDYATCAILNLNKVPGILTVELGGFQVA
jgi:hypothetical protein